METKKFQLSYDKFKNKFCNDFCVSYVYNKHQLKSTKCLGIWLVWKNNAVDIWNLWTRFSEQLFCHFESHRFSSFIPQEQIATVEKVLNAIILLDVVDVNVIIECDGLNLKER